MKILFIFLLLQINKSEVLKGNIYSNQCGCQLYIQSQPLEYTQFNRIAYAQYLTDQINYFHQKMAYSIRYVTNTDENVFQFTIQSLSSLPLDAITSDGVNYQLIQKMQQTQFSNAKFQKDENQWNLIQNYFKQFTEEEKRKQKDLYFSDYFKEDMLNKPYISQKLIQLLSQIQASAKQGDSSSNIELKVKENLLQERSAIAFKIVLTIQGKFGLQKVSFILLHLLNFESRSTQYYFKDDVYYFQVDSELDLSQQGISVNIDKAINFEEYIYNKTEDQGLDGQLKKLSYQNFYTNPGLREIQRSCIGASSALRAGIGAALSELLGFHYGDYNVCYQHSFLHQKIYSKSNDSFSSYVQPEQNNIFGILDVFNFQHEYYIDKQTDPNQYSIVRNIFAQQQSNLLKQPVELYFENNLDNSGQKFQFGCQTFKDSFDYNIQNVKFAVFIYYIKGSNFIYIDCDKKDHEVGFLIFRGKRIMKLYFTTYLGENGSTEQCFRSQFIMPQLLKSSLMCLKRPEKEQLLEIYDKNQSHLSFYQIYYKQPLQEIFNVTEILQDMTRNAINIKIIYEALLQPFFQQAKDLQVDVQELIQQGSNDIQMPFLQQPINSLRYLSKRGSIITVNFISNPIAEFKIKLIEGEEEFIKLVFTDGLNEKEFLFPKFILTDNVDIIRDFQSKEDLFQKEKKHITQILQQRYLPEITKYLKENLDKTLNVSKGDVQGLEKDNYKLSIEDNLMSIYSSLDFVSLYQSMGIAMYQIMSLKFKQVFMDKEIEDYVYKPTTYMQEEIQLGPDTDIGFKNDQGVSYDVEKVNRNFDNIVQAFTFSRTYYLGEDDKDVRSFIYQRNDKEKRSSAYNSLQEFADKLYRTESQSKWLFLQDKQELDRLSNDYFLYFNLDEVMVGGLMDQVQKKNFLESFVIGIDMQRPLGISFILGDREANRYLLLSFGGLRTEYFKLLQITFFSIYFKSQFLIQLSDFQSIWHKIFDIITSVSSHYNQIAQQSYDMLLEGQDITMEDIQKLILEKQQQYNLNFFSQEHKNQNTEELDGLTYLMPNSNLGEQGIPNELKDQKIVVTVSKKEFQNGRKGYIMRFFDSKLPIQEQPNQQYTEKDLKQVQHSQLEFYNSYNFDYLIILGKFIEENLQKYQEKQIIQFIYKRLMKKYLFLFFILLNQYEGHQNCSDRSGIVFEIDNFVFTELSQILNRDIIPNFLQKELSEITNQNIQQFQSTEEGQRKEFNFNSILINSFEINYFGINEDDEIELTFKNISFFLDADIKLQVTKYVLFGKYYNLFGQVQLQLKIEKLSLTFDFKKFMQQEPYPQIQFKNTNIKIDVSKQKIGFNFSQSNFMINWTGQLTQYTVNKDFIKNFIIRNTLDYMIDLLEQKMTKIINQIIRAYYPEKVNITGSIFFSTKMICQPQFGGQRHKRIRIYMDAEIFDESEIQQIDTQIKKQQNQEKQKDYKAQNFVKLMLSQKNFKDTIELFTNEVLKKELLQIANLQIDNEEREITLENQIENLNSNLEII